MQLRQLKTQDVDKMIFSVLVALNAPEMKIVESANSADTDKAAHH